MPSRMMAQEMTARNWTHRHWSPMHRAQLVMGPACAVAASELIRPRRRASWPGSSLDKGSWTIGWLETPTCSDWLLATQTCLGKLATLRSRGEDEKSSSRSSTSYSALSLLREVHRSIKQTVQRPWNDERSSVPCTSSATSSSSSSLSSNRHGSNDARTTLTTRATHSEASRQLSCSARGGRSPRELGRRAHQLWAACWSSHVLGDLPSFASRRA